MANLVKTKVCLGEEVADRGTMHVKSDWRTIIMP